MQKSIFSKIFFLLLLTFFIVEYLNPSAIGVRADFNPVTTGSSPLNNQNSHNTDPFSLTTHSMILSEAFCPGEIFPIAYFFSAVRFIIEQTKSKEIFHPPAAIL